MREMKFRAWDKEAHQMLYGGMEFALRCLELEGMNDNYPIPIGFSNEFEGKRFEIMQFTNLYDNNNTPIYESDIVRRWWHRENKWGPYAVVSLDIFEDSSGDSIMGWIAEDCGIDNRCFVCGNIYENPERINE